MEHEQDTAAPASDERTQHWVECLRKVATEQDTHAFRQLFDQYAPMIKAFAYKVPALEQSDSFAEELLQETMLRVWTRAHSFDPRLSSPGTWIFTLARNMRIDLLRKQARHVVNTVAIESGEDGDGEWSIEDFWIEDEDMDLFNQLAQQRSRKQIHESLHTLPPEQAFVLRKIYLEDLSHSEVAQQLDLPLGTVKSRVRLALNKLRLIVDR